MDKKVNDLMKTFERLRERLFNSATQFFGFDDETNRNLNIRIRSGASANALGNFGSVDSNSSDAGLMIHNFNEDFNNSTWDRHRNNVEVTVFASAARTATVASSEIINYNGRGARFHRTITAAS
jgi:hypothetical protein